ncbi:alpha/beta fold hydrolase [Beijerinckia sp. L45]|uniref:alpha/beta fold hydrolase n=1 Tax=Beijerinckia sp. L45 TaxID=1641855 RepID=UPI00131DCAD8|nr:alpha/beta hydrolase [Beijerinckia sp. L45]
MDLFATPGNPIPPDAIISAVRTEDGLTLRVARWVARRDGRGTVFIAMGRSEFIEEYFEVITDLLDRRFDVVIVDWRGQGQSDREIARRRRGHVRHFDAYKRDLAAIEAQILRPFATKPWFALGHSMGGAILLDQAHDGRSPFARLVLSAPMIDLPLRFRNAIARFMAVAAWLGFDAMLIPGGQEDSIFKRGFDGNPLTSDPQRYSRTSVTIETSPNLAVGAPTIGWLHAAFRLMNRFQNPRFAIETVTPILIMAAGADRIVDTKATERFSARLKAGHCITLAEARHEVIMERDDIRERFWAAFDAFIPGSEGAHVRETGVVDRQRTTTLAPTGTR